MQRLMLRLEESSSCGDGDRLLAWKKSLSSRDDDRSFKFDDSTREKSCEKKPRSVRCGGRRSEGEEVRLSPERKSRHHEEGETLRTNASNKVN